MNINMEDLKNKFGRKAKEYANDKEKTEKLLYDANRKAKKLDKSGPIDKLLQQLQLLFGLVKDSINGSYKDVPKGSIIIIIMGILYFLSPIDIIPDFLPFGYTDDAFVLSLVIKQVKSDIEKYQIWKLDNLNTKAREENNI